jgi:hypothetical protein
MLLSPRIARFGDKPVKSASPTPRRPQQSRIQFRPPEDGGGVLMLDQIRDFAARDVTEQGDRPEQRRDARKSSLRSMAGCYGQGRGAGTVGKASNRCRAWANIDPFECDERLIGARWNQ